MNARFRQWHERARGMGAMYRLALISRILLALAFVPTAVVKVTGNRFTTISASTPIGYFFEAMYQSGFYWRFLGASQLLAGLLLLIPATSTLGAVLFFPIILNIFVITVSLHFTGTPVITGLMLLASIFLLCWDYHRFAPILWGPAAAYEVAPTPSFPGIERLGYALGAAAGMGILFSARGLVAGGTTRVLLVACLIAAAIASVMVLSGWRVAARLRNT